MGAVGGMLGLSGGNSGTGYSTPSGTNAGQINTAYNNSQTGMGNQNALLSALQGQNGLGNQTQNYNQLQGVINGTGPNPAQAMLNQSTGANVANQAALMAGQRGAGANPALMARQAAMQGANLQQQAAGQGASMQAQQALGAIGQAGGMANTMAANQIGQTNANIQAAQNEQNILQGANSANNQIQGQLANTTMGGQQKLIGGGLNALGGMFADGGQVGGAAFGPQSMFGQFVNQPQENMQQFSNPDTKSYDFKQKPKQDPMAGAKDVTSSMGDMSGLVAAGGGKVPAVVSPGERFLKPEEAKAVANGAANPLSVGKQIPGQAKVKGDSYKNDTVPAKLDVGGVVIPRSVMDSKDPARGAADFVRAVMAKKGKKK